MLVGPPEPTVVASTTNVSDRVAEPPWLSTVSSFSVPPLDMKVPGPATPATRAPVITSTSPAAGLLCRSIVPELMNVDEPTPIRWPCNGPPIAIALLGLPSGRYCPVLSSFVAPVTWGSASVPLLVKLLFGPVPRSAIATRSVSRPVPVVSAKCCRLNVPLLMMLLLPPVNCTKPVMVPLLVMVLLLSPAIARSDNAPMLPLLISVAGPPVEFRVTPAAGRPNAGPTLVRSGCQPPITDPPDTMLMALPLVVATIPLLNSPVDVIGPEEVTFMLPLPDCARIPTPFPPSVVMPGPV